MAAVIDIGVTVVITVVITAIVVIILMMKTIVGRIVVILATVITLASFRHIARILINIKTIESIKEQVQFLCRCCCCCCCIHLRITGLLTALCIDDKLRDIRHGDEFVTIIIVVIIITITIDPLCCN